MQIIQEGYTRVSEILSAWTDFSKINPEVLAKKARAGTEVHEWIYSFFNEEIYPVNEKAGEYLEAFKSAFSKEIKRYEPVFDGEELFMEKRLYSEKYKITGQIDALFSHEGKTILVDYKTSYSTNIPYWQLQMTLYSLLLEENGVCDRPKAMILHLKKRGSFSLIDIPIQEKHRKMARAAIALYRHFNN